MTESAVLKTTLSKLVMIYEGKAKKIFASNNPKELIQEFKDSLTAFNAKKKGSFEGKGAVNLRITSCIFENLKLEGIPSHFLQKIDDTHMLVEKLKMIPLEVVVRNRAAGSICTRLGLQEGINFSNPLVEFFYKKDELNDPLVTDDHVVLLGAATRDELTELGKKALNINTVLKNMFAEAGIDLIDFKIEFGKDEEGQIKLADEISPDSCRLWDITTGKKLDKDRFRQDLGEVEESYNFICEKLLSRWELK
jgi:phosphoribosylaminoimidazole-succinocarboxamide synthase